MIKEVATLKALGKDAKEKEAIKNAILDIVGKKGEIDTEELSKVYIIAV